MNLRATLNARIGAALAAAGAPEGSDAMVAPAGRPEFGDYQANGVMAAAKKLRTNPRQLAEKVCPLAAVKLDDLAEKVEVAGPGFINITLRPAWMAAELTARIADGRLGVDTPPAPQTVVVDYSAPNIAKEMQVFHLRSTIIGDALVRVLDFLGHEVIRQNHVGDWGRQFGVVILGLWHICMARRGQESGKPGYIDSDGARLLGCKPGEEPTLRLLEAIRDRHQADWETDRRDTKGDGNLYFGPFLDRFVERRDDVSFDQLLDAYRFVTRIEDLAAGTTLGIPIRREGENGGWEYPRIPYAQLSRHVASMLQDFRNADNRQEGLAWHEARKRSIEKCSEVYHRLGVLLTDGNVRSESAYRDDLPKVVADLRAAGLLSESQGAQCVFLEEFRGKDGEITPLIVRKSDEGFLYATTDLAAIRHRVRELKADRVLYVVDARQALHFRQVFAVARKAGFAPDSVSLEHVGFGTMMGPDGRPFKTREGGTVKLMDLLEEAEQRAFALVSQKNPDLPEERRRQIARAVGIGAVKYADLSQNRNSDYVFSWDKMLSLEGNTAPYMQYAYARVRSIFRKGGLAQQIADCGLRIADLPEDGRSQGWTLGLGASGRYGICIGHPAERALAVRLAQFPETMEIAARECLPNLLCGYLYDLAGAFMGFYESCPVLKAGDEATVASRLLLCHLTARTIQKGLDLLGIETLEQM